MKTAIVSGASRGIGAQTAIQLAEKGYLVIVNYCNSQKDAQNVCDRINSRGGMAISYKADVSDPLQIKEMTNFVVRTYGKIDLVVANAGVGHNCLLTDMTDKDIKRIIDTDLTGVITLAREGAKSMLKNHSGNIITVSSMWGQVGASCESIYSAAKGGIIAFTKALAKELGANGIRVNCVAPGLIDTDINNNLTFSDKQSLVDETPLCRMGTAQDVANAIVWLASDESSFITGHVLSVNGGMII